MKVKEIARTANVAWSPAPHHPIYLAAGTAAQQLDATFSTSAALEIFALDLTSGDREMPVKGTLSSEHRFHKLVWGTNGMQKEETPSGVLVGGTDSGHVVVWNPVKILNGETEDAVLFQTDKHTGAVQALDFNPFQPNILASGAVDSEIYIWDLNNPDNAITPGAKSLPPDNISCLAWNRQVQHILASTSPCGRCVVFDLRKNEQIIKLSDQGSMARCKAIEWHPDVPTQLVLASEDDRCPVIQMWDLRYATSPMKVLDRHQRGVLSIAWCPQDPELLMSCGKDSRILCWNPNSNDPRGEVVYELPCPAQWSFDVQWCPRNPNMICTPSFDGHVSIYSLMGGGIADHSGVDQKTLNDAFDINDSFTASVQHQTTADHIPAASTLKKPPKWLRRPCGASFGFGGKLVSFGKTPEAPVSKINLSQVVTEEDLVNRSNLLEGALASGSFAEFCRTKIESGAEDLDSTLWSFLKVNFEGEPRKQFLTLLGYDPNNLAKKIAAKMGEVSSPSTQGVDASILADKIKTLTLPTTVSSESESVFSGGALTPSVPEDHGKTPISETLDPSRVFDAISAGTLDTSGEEICITTPFSIPTDNESDGLISQALLTGNFEAAVDVCFHSDRMADAFLLAIAGGPELLAKTQQMYFQKKKSDLKRLMSVVVNRDWPDVVKSCNLDNWREALAILVTYAKPEEFAPLCDLLGQRLEAQQDENYANAMVCYICAGNVEKFVSCWSKTMPSEPSPLELQNLIEKVMILKKAVEKERRQVVKATNSHVSEMLCKYAGILASQGSVEIAMEYLMSANDQDDVAVLRDRLYYAQYPSHVTSSITPPTFPFPRVDVKAAPAVQPQQQASQVQQSFAPSQVQQNTGIQQQPPSSSFYNPGSYNPPQAPPTHAPTSLPGQHQFPHTSYYHGNPSPTQTTHGYPSQNPSYGGNVPNIPPPTSHGPSTLGNQPPSPGQYNAPPPSTLIGYPNTAPPISGYGVSNTPGVPSSYPPPPGQPSQPHSEPPPPTSTWSADGTHAIAKKHQPTNYTPPAPITMPIFNAPAEQQPGQTGNHTGNAMASMIPQGGGVPPGAPPQGPLQNVPIESQPEPEKAVAKGPIPAEHIQLQEAFDGLVAKCRGTAMNQQTKKKLDDVTKKLGALYDKLREQKLSPSILGGLHNIAQACQAADYPSGYQAYTHLISSGSFSEISSFMPGIKSLMQVATQLRV